eukprot:COSAG01_NODE_35300_length_534_cov_0.600000_2_plen_29_part_01
MGGGAAGVGDRPARPVAPPDLPGNPASYV